MKRSNPKRLSLNNIDSIISKFEANTMSSSSPLLPQDSSLAINSNSSLSKSIGPTTKRRTRHKMSEIATPECDNEDRIDEPGVDRVIVKSKSGAALRTCQRSCFDYLYHCAFMLLKFPFFTSIHRAGLATLSCAFFLPRFVSQLFFYPIFRLIFGTLYPAYASYKAVRSKKEKEYVSKRAADRCRPHQTSHRLFLLKTTRTRPSHFRCSSNG